MKGSGGTGTAARRTGAHWSALCILRSGSPSCSRPFFSKPLPPFLRSNLGVDGVHFLSPEAGGFHHSIAGEAAQERPTILIDCVTLWVSNILFALPEPEDLTAFETAVRTEVNALLALMERSNCRWILVSGETGLGGIASDRISRNYCDGLGLANQLIAASARKVFLVVAGCSLVLAE